MGSENAILGPALHGADTGAELSGAEWARAEIAVMAAAEAIRERRIYRGIPAQAARGVSALWRSIATGGWE